MESYHCRQLSQSMLRIDYNINAKANEIDKFQRWCTMRSHLTKDRILSSQRLVSIIIELSLRSRVLFNTNNLRCRGITGMMILMTYDTDFLGFTGAKSIIPKTTILTANPSTMA